MTHVFRNFISVAVASIAIVACASSSSSPTGKVLFKCTQSNTCDGTSGADITVPDICDDQSKSADDEGKAANAACIPAGNPDGGDCAAKACTVKCTKTSTACNVS